MAKFPDLEGFAFSFSHGKIKLNDKQYTAIEDISISQGLEEGTVMGASQKVLRRSAGQLTIGDGTVTFSDYEEAQQFIEDLGDKPLNKIWACEYVLENESGVVKQIECQSCRVLTLSVSHAQGPGALGMELPFSFLLMKVNGKELV